MSFKTAKKIMYQINITHILNTEAKKDHDPIKYLKRINIFMITIFNKSFDVPVYSN